jgi:hypothetical protein
MRALLVVLGAVLLSLGGCPWNGVSGANRALLSVAGNHAYVQYWPRSSGWEILPSALYEVELATGAGTRRTPPERQAGPQVSGDYYVTEVPAEARTLGRVVRDYLASSDRAVLYERTLDWDSAFYTEHILAGGYLAVRTTTEVKRFTMPQGVVADQLALPADAGHLLAFDGTRAIVGHEDAQNASPGYLFDFVTDEMSELPDIAGATPFYVEAGVAGDWIVVSRAIAPDNSLTERHVDVYGLRAADTEWTLLWEADNMGSVLFPALSQLADFDGARVILRWDRPVGTTWTGAYLSIAVDTREATTVAEWSRSSPLGPKLAGDRLYWLDDILPALVTLDLTTLESTTVPLVLAD